MLVQKLKVWVKIRGGGVRCGDVHGGPVTEDSAS